MLRIVIMNVKTPWKTLCDDVICIQYDGAEQRRHEKHEKHEKHEETWCLSASTLGTRRSGIARWLEITIDLGRGICWRRVIWHMPHH
jgi:hypothetical protein